MICALMMCVCNINLLVLSREFSGMIDNNYNHSILPFPSIPYVKRTRKSLACHNLAHPQGPNGAMSFYCGEIQGAVAM